MRRHACRGDQVGRPGKCFTARRLRPLLGRRLRLELLEERRLLSGLEPLASGEIHGLVVNDLNRNRRDDTGEPGLADVTVYVDLDRDGQFDSGEPSAVTAADDPDTPEVDETGTYAIAGVPAGPQLVRYLRPLGFEPSFPRTPPVSWATQSDSAAEDEALGLAVDTAGFIVSVGSVQGGTFDGSGPVEGVGGWIAMHTAGGELLWRLQVDSAGDDVAEAVDTDSEGNLYVAGFTSGVLGDASAGADDAWLAKYTPSGDLVWMRQFGTPSEDRALGVAVDDADRIYVAGYTLGTLGDASAGQADAFLARFDVEGSEQWMVQLGTSAADEARDVATDGELVYVGGITDGKLGSYEYGPYVEDWIARYDDAGSQVWIAQYQPSHADANTTGIGAGSGAAFISGSTADGDAFIGSYGVNRNPIGRYSDSTFSGDVTHFHDVAVDTGGVGWMIGYSDDGFAAPADPGNVDGILGTKDTQDTSWFPEKYQIGTPEDDRLLAVDAAPDGSIVVAGGTAGSLAGVNAGGGADAFWMKIDPGLTSPQLVVVESGATAEGVVLGVRPHLFEVTATDPEDYARLTAAPAALLVDLNHPVAPESVEASDLTIEGQPALGASVVDGDTLRFDLPPLDDGRQDWAIAAGSILSDEGVPIEARAGRFYLDTVAPVVTIEPRVTTDRTPPFSGTVDDTGATVELFVDGQTYSAANYLDGTWSLEDNVIARVGFGWHDVVVSATDTYGNVGTDATTEDLRVTAPAYLGTSDGPAAEMSSFTLDLGSPDPEAVLGWEVDWGDGTVDTLGAGALTASHLYADGPDHFPIRVTATDAGGEHRAYVALGFEAPLDPTVPDPTIVTQFAADSFDRAFKVVFQPDGKVVAAGHTSAAGGQQFALARYNVDGSLDATFGQGGLAIPAFDSLAYAYGLAIQADGKIVVGGFADDDGLGGAPGYGVLARLMPDGSLDNTFGDGGWVVFDVTADQEYLADVALLDDGKIVAVGSADGDFLVARFESDGSPDATFGHSGPGYTLSDYIGFGQSLEAMALYPDGSFVAAGRTIERHLNNDLNTDYVVCRYTADGQLDTAFDEDGIRVLTQNSTGFDEATDVAIDSQGRILVTGQYDTHSGSSYYRASSVVRLLGDGSVDPSFGANGRRSIDLGYNLQYHAEAIDALPDGRVLVGGESYVTGDSNNLDFALAMLTEDGELDDRFSQYGVWSVDVGDQAQWMYDVTVDPYGRIAAAGYLAWSEDFAVLLLRTDVVRVDDVPPAIEVTGPETADRDRLYTLGFSATDVGDDTVESWTIDWGDGHVDVVPASATETTHVYETLGDFSITVTATDEDGDHAAPGPTVTVQQALDAEIRGTKRNDLDGDGVRDPGEPGLAGWTIFLDEDGDGQLDAGETSTTTGADGSYVLSGLDPGTHVVAEQPQPGWEQTWPGPGGFSYGPFPLQFDAVEFVQADGVTVQLEAYSVPSMVDWNDDGRPDLLVGEKVGTVGKIRLYLNQGSATAPGFASYEYVQSAGSDLEAPAEGCLGAFPRVADLDGDGRKDLVVGMADGRVQAFFNIGTDDAPVFSRGLHLQVGPPDAKVNIAVGSRATLEVVDWNNDGKLDLVAGAYDGRVRVYLNEAAVGAPDFQTDLVVQDGAADLLVPSGRASVAVTDLDGDGRKDLVLGNTDGQVYFYANAGTDDAPAFSGSVLLESAGLPISLGTTRSRPFVFDVNADGGSDLLVGGADGLVRLYKRASDAQPSAYTIDLGVGDGRQGVDFGNHFAASLDVDGSGAADALSDGVLMLRYLFGFTGAPLVEDAVDPAGGRTDPDDIAQFLDNCRDTMLDVDLSGAADALTDGILILRHLFGFTGDALVQEALAPDATRTDPADIAAFLDQFMPLGPVGESAAAVEAAGAVALAEDGTAEPLDDPLQYEANQPIGEAKGLHPGRVSWIHDPQATSWDGSSGHWWDDGNTDPAVVAEMLSKALRWLAGETTDAAAWDAIFRNFNQTHGGVAVGYVPGEKIAVKLNLNNAWSGYGDADNQLDASPQFVLALVRQLVDAGVRPEDLTLFDASRPIPHRIYDPVHAEFPDVQLADRYGEYGRIQVQPDLDPNNMIYYSGGSRETMRLPIQVTEAKYLINVANLKKHDTAGMTMTAKNCFGAIMQLRSSQWEWSPSNLHGYVNGDNPMGAYNPLVDLVAHRHLGGKTVLYVIDGLYGAFGCCSDPQRWSTFGNDWPSSIFLSQDPVAIDSVAMDFLRAETSIKTGTENYLHESALIEDPPSGTTYDPHNDGTPLASLGVHEHWDGADTKRYTRNLGTGEGIELISQAPPELQINPAAVSQLEGASGTTPIELTVSLSGPAQSPVQVTLSTADGTATVADGDYQPIGGSVLTFNPGGPLTQAVTVLVNGDLRIEEDESFTVHLSGATGALLTADTATVTVVNDDLPSLDVEANSEADALSDGIVVLRYLFGFTGEALVEDALSPGAGRTAPAEIAEFLDTCRPTMLDADANGAADALTDGVLILRHLFGFTGDALVEDALASDATRTDPVDIAAFLDQFIPTARGSSPLAPLAAEPIETTSRSMTATAGAAERIDAIWGESPRDGGKDEWLAADQARRASLYRALAYDAVGSRAKVKRHQKPAADEVDLLMLQPR